ncbi:MAG: hypothetical protein B7Y43_09655 [Sphingomonas sp. 28-62-20]|uniref:DUF4230 domain-containing protein n=1 Tax=Sphingomonas sp. 28-62-20 TaxID=1970433 RepID=UPI000BC53F96|nr:MAG: hypothetical protein B7Y43_09655 [Sphingomonas sp. 28-62-20]
MADDLKPAGSRWLINLLIIIGVGLLGFLAYDRFRERYTPSVDDGGNAVTQLVSARLSGASSLKVASLTGIIQSRATDVRGFGWLRSDQVIKMPYSVDYFVDVSGIGPDQIEWDAKTETLIVNAPDVTVAAPNIDEAHRTMVETTGVIVTREASEALSQQASQNATNKAQKEAGSPARIAQAREQARAALSNLLTAPLSTLGHANARVIVTFPPERRRVNGEQWDVSRSVEEVVGGRQ